MFTFLLNSSVAIPEAVSDVAPSTGDLPTPPPRPALGLTFDEVRRLTQPPQPQRRPASEFAHLTEPDKLALELRCSVHQLDLTCPEIQRLIESTKGSVQGAFLADRLAPKTFVGKPKAVRRKSQPKPRQPILPNLISFANELDAAQSAQAARDD